MSQIVADQSVVSEPEASCQCKVECCPNSRLDFQRFPEMHGDEQAPIDDHQGVDDPQRVLDIGEDSSSDESYIGQSNVLASSSSDDDHDPVVFAPLEVGDPFAGLARATSGHSDALMDPLVQKAIKSRRQRRKRSNILRTRMQESRISEEPKYHCAETYVDPEFKNANVETRITSLSPSMMHRAQRAYESFHSPPMWC